MIYPDQEQTSDHVADHYNSLDEFYRKLWGEHIHHGYWITGKEKVKQATEQLIDLVVEAGHIGEDTLVCDVGCGYGATSRYLVKNHGAKLTAITISKGQWQFARASDPESTNPRYVLADFLDNQLPSEAFDTVISIESSEHMPDKEKFFQEVHRILKPGGRFVTCVWLAKEDPKPHEIKYFLEPICREGRLPSMGSESDYRRMMKETGFTEVSFEDISNSVKKTWSICALRTAKNFIFDKKLRRYLLSKKSTNRAFARTLFRIWGAYKTKAMRYGLFSAVKK